MSMGNPAFYFKIEALIWLIFCGQRLNKNRLSLLHVFQRLCMIFFLVGNSLYSAVQACMFTNANSVSSSSVVRASDWITEGCGFKFHLGLGFFPSLFFSMYLYHVLSSLCKNLLVKHRTWLIINTALDQCLFLQGSPYTFFPSMFCWLCRNFFWKLHIPESKK